MDIHNWIVDIYLLWIMCIHDLIMGIHNYLCRMAKMMFSSLLFRLTPWTQEIFFNIFGEIRVC